MTLVFSGFSFILHLAHYFANFRRSFATNCTVFSVVRIGKSLTYIRKVMDSGQNPVEPLQWV